LLSFRWKEGHGPGVLTTRRPTSVSFPLFLPVTPHWLTPCCPPRFAAAVSPGLSGAAGCPLRAGRGPASGGGGRRLVKEPASGQDTLVIAPIGTGVNRT